MKKEIICFGVRDYEVSTFEELGKKYDYKLVLKKEYLTNDNYELGLNYEVVMVRGNCFLNYDSIKALKESGLKYLLTRTVGFNHIDLDACKKLDVACARVPGYSPNSVAELAVTYIMALNRSLVFSVNETSQGDFRVKNEMFSPEIRNLTVAVLGCGRIGLTSATLLKGMGARVIGYDVFQSDRGREVLDKYATIEEVQKEADIITVHMPYFKGENDNFINADFISKMKDGTIIVNTARGELVDASAIADAVESGKLRGAALDVIANEKLTFFKKHEGALEDPVAEKLRGLYPRVLMTPHVGSATDEALKNMVEVSLQNLDEYLSTNTCKNSLIK